MNLQVGAKVLIKNKSGRILLLKRTTRYDVASETTENWDIPGGRIEPDESLLVALSREMKEELGVELVGTPELLLAQDIFVPAKSLHVIRLTYVHEMEVNTDSLVLSDEHTAHEWLTVSDAQQLPTEPYLREALQLL